MASADVQTIAIPQPKPAAEEAASHPPTTRQNTGSPPMQVAALSIPMPYRVRVIRRVMASADAQAIAIPHPRPTPDSAVLPALTTAGAPTNAAHGDAHSVQQRAAMQLLRSDFKKNGLKIFALKLDHHEALVYFENKRFRDPAIAIGRAVRLLANALPKRIEVMTVVIWERGLEAARLSMLRKDIENSLRNRGSSVETLQNVRVHPSLGTVEPGAVYASDAFPKFNWSIDPAIRQGLFDPDAPYLYQFWARIRASVRLARSLDLTSTLGFNLVDNFERSTRGSDSVLPHVRSDVIRYIREGANGIDDLRLTYLRNLTPNFYGRITTGLLEEMYAGVAGEVLFRAPERRLAIGLDLNAVQKRAFNKRFGLRDYKVMTGHLSFYYDSPFHDYLASVSLGRYLARDWGTTINLTRQFNSGVKVGAFVTFTTVPFEEFGEGSFDKGISITIPLDIFHTRHTQMRGGTVVRPLTRDGGQRVVSGPTLYDLTNRNRWGNISRNWRKIFD